MKSKCLSERLKRVLKRWLLRKSNLVAIKHLCSDVRSQWGGQRLVGPSSFTCRRQGARTCTVRGAGERCGEKVTPGEGRGSP